MTKFCLISTIFFLLAFPVHFFGRTDADSLLELRDNNYKDYIDFRNSMGQRTWINMVNLNSKAYEIIKNDEQLIKFLKRERELTKELNTEISQLQMQITLLKKEAEIQRLLIDEKNYISKLFLIVIGALLILFLIILILFIDRQTRYRTTRMELEKSWMIDNKKDQEKDLEIENKLNYRIQELELKNKQLNNKNSELQHELTNRNELLEKEINSKKKIEEEIKTMISQIKQNKSG